MKISKSKKELAKIIHENGGWRDGMSFSWYGNKTKKGYFGELRPRFDRVSGGMVAYGDLGVNVVSFECTKLPNWHQTILSREEYFHLYPAPDADGWIEWKGGKCPVERGTIVDVKYANNIINYGVSALTNSAHEGHVRGTAGSMTATNWGAGLPMSGIIAYRMHKPEIEAAIQEPNHVPDQESKPTIEQLAAEYRNAKDYAECKQRETEDAKADAEARLAELIAAGKAIGLVLGVADAAPVATKFTGKFHSAKYGDRPNDLDMICDGCGKRFGHHVGFDCRP